jgi:hypothetical protein
MTRYTASGSCCPICRPPDMFFRFTYQDGSPHSAEKCGVCKGWVGRMNPELRGILRIDEGVLPGADLLGASFRRHAGFFQFTPQGGLADAQKPGCPGTVASG